MKYVAILMLCALVLGLPTINFQHHLNLPDLDKNKITVVEIVNFDYPYLHKIIDIRLKSEIKGEDTQRDVYKILAEAQTGDTITFHLAGYGGDGFTMFELINNIKASKAIVSMIVEAPVFSAHAYLATAGQFLTMEPYSFLMFHTLSSYGTDCSKETGTDRTVSNVEHCQALQDTLNNISIKLIANTPILTLDEKLRILTGHDVYITADQYNERKKQHDL